MCEEIGFEPTAVDVLNSGVSRVDTAGGHDLDVGNLLGNGRDSLEGQQASFVIQQPESAHSRSKIMDKEKMRPTLRARGRTELPETPP